MKIHLVVLAVVALLVGSPSTGSPAGPDKLSELMVRKLTCAQKVLEGLAVNDFDRISRNADELILISKQAEWRVLKTTQYELHSNDFRRIAGEMVKSAKAKNLDASALHYVELTLTCVKCHKYVREVRMTSDTP